MKKFAALMAIIFALAATSAAAGEEQDVSQAIAAAESWLAIIDLGKYGEGWERAASTFQKGISKDKWEQAVGNARAPIGPVKSRILVKAAGTPKVTTLAVGDVVVLQFTSAFEKLAPAIETVTPFRETDGTWKVSGYYIKPASKP